MCGWSIVCPSRFIVNINKSNSDAGILLGVALFSLPFVVVLGPIVGILSGDNFAKIWRRSVGDGETDFGHCDGNCLSLSKEQNGSYEEDA